MTKINIVIVDDSVEYNKLINDYLTKVAGTIHIGYNFNVVGRAFNGQEAIDIIKKTEPDIVILDLILPEVDGLGVMQFINDSQMARRPIFVILTSVRSERINNLTSVENSVGAFFIKPTDFDVLSSRIIQLTSTQPVSVKLGGKSYVVDKRNALNTLIASVVSQTGVKSHYKGYQYIINCVRLSIENPEYLCLGITKQLYPLTGKQFNTTAARVERDIRNAIKNAYDSDEFTYFYKITNMDYNTERVKPTTGFYISSIIKYLNTAELLPPSNTNSNLNP